MKDEIALPTSDDPANINARPLRHALASISNGASPVSTASMISDWALHLAAAPDKQLELVRKAHDNWVSWTTFLAQGCPSDVSRQPIQPQKTDRRFRHTGWNQVPFNAWAQAFLLAEDFFDAATSDVPGLSASHDKAMTFLTRQVLDAFAPGNFLATNPEAIARTVETHGQNLIAA